MIDMHVSLSLAYGQHPRQQVDVMVPERLQGKVVIVLCHGGWWSQGRHQELRSLALFLNEQGFATINVGTRLLNDGARSGQDIIDDVKAGVAKALDEAAIHGASDHSVIFMGSGSGSLTALTTAMQLFNDERIRVRGFIGCGVTPTLEVWEGCSTTTSKILEQFSGHTRQLLNPMEMPADRLPPLFLIHGDSDNEVPARLAQRLHARAIEANEDSHLIVLTGIGHSFIEQPYERSGKNALERLMPFLHAHVNEPDSAELFLGHCSTPE